MDNSHDFNEPVAYSVGNTLKWHEGKGMTNAQLFAAPKALAPLTDKEVSRLWSVAHDDTTDRMAFQVLARLVEKHHGITKGTPT